MANILFPTFGTLGDVHPFLAIALELQARGHKPTIATLEIYRSKIEEAGIGFEPIPPHFDNTEKWKEQVPRLMDGQEGTTRLFREVLMPNLKATYETLLPFVQQADLVVAHPIVCAVPLCCEVSGKPWLSATLAPVGYWSVHDRMFPVGFRGAEKIRTSPFAQRILKKILAKRSLPLVREVSELRRELKLSTRGHPLLDRANSPHGGLALFSKELGAPQPDWPARTQQTGFCFYDRKGGFGNDGTSTLAPAIKEFIQAGGPPIVFTLGSAAIFDARNFYEAAVEASRQLKRRALLLVGFESNRPASLPENDSQIAAFEYAPFSEVFPQAVAIVHQGGVGTTGQALQAGVPSLFMPCSHDQPDNAWRIQRRGAARIMDRDYCNSQHMTEQLSELLGNPEYAQKARAIGQRMQQENGTVSAANAIEQQLSALK
jgi:rhamnosyltransferase subunit B